MSNQVESLAQQSAQFLAIKIVADILRRIETELSPVYVYHNLDHSKDVLSEALRFAIAEGVDQRSIELIAIAAAYHEAGFLIRAQANEGFAAEMAKNAMQASGEYSDIEIKLVCQMILDTELQNIYKGPAQVASTELSKYLLDADVANLGRDDFFTKMELIGQESNIERQTLLKQTLQLCRAHQWQTKIAAELLEAKKQENMQKLAAMME